MQIEKLLEVTKSEEIEKLIEEHLYNNGRPPEAIYVGTVVLRQLELEVIHIPGFTKIVRSPMLWAMVGNTPRRTIAGVRIHHIRGDRNYLRVI